VTIEVYSVAALAIVLVGISKAGFGGGTGILATPLMAMVFPASEAIGILLPLLILTDLISLYFYWGDWEKRPFLRFLPGCIVGIAVGSMLLGVVDDRWLSGILGVICIGFCLLRWLARYRKTMQEHAEPGWKKGSIMGVLTGITSTLAHAAGPVFTIYILPYGYSPRKFVATTLLAFTWVNLLKCPSYLGMEVISSGTLVHSLILIPWVPVGALIGLWMNRHLSPERFKVIIYLILFLSGLKLIYTSIEPSI
jgi:uncharacterized membrane protein YfcA